MFSFLLVLTIIVTLVFTAYTYKKNRSRMVRMVNKLDGPKTIPFFGNVFYFLCSRDEILQKLLNMRNEYIMPVRIWLFNKPVVFIHDVEDVKIVLNNELEKGDLYTFVEEALGDCLFTYKVEKWKHHRRFINPVFHKPSSLKEFTKMFHRHNLRMVKELAKEVDAFNVFDLWPYISHTAISIICETTVGYHSEADTEMKRFCEIFFKGSQLIMKRIVSPWLYPSFIYNFWINNYHGYKEMRDILNSFPMKILESRKEAIKFENQESNEKEERSLNVIDSLLRSPDAEKHFTNQDIVNEVLIIIAAGTEASAITTCFLLLMLAMNPDIQYMVYNEIYAVFGDSNRHPDVEDLLKLPYLDQCIKETLRRFSVSGIISRKIGQDIELSNGNVIPKGIDVVISLLTIYLDPTNFPNPLVWNPENFNSEVERERQQYAFTPFGFGPRSCIASKYAMVKMKDQVSTVLRNFRLSTNIKMDDLEIALDILVRSKNGYPVQLEYRHGKSIF